MTRDDLRVLMALEVDWEGIGLLEPGAAQAPYFCTSVGAEYVGRLGVDGIHFVPAVGDLGTYVLPVAADMREFLSFLLFCRDDILGIGR